MPTFCPIFNQHHRQQKYSQESFNQHITTISSRRSVAARSMLKSQKKRSKKFKKLLTLGCYFEIVMVHTVTLKPKPNTK